MFGFPVYAEFMHIASNRVVPLPGKNSKYYGGHAIMAVGYDDNIQFGPDKGALLIGNSWGIGWGLKSYTWLGYKYVNDPRGGLLDHDFPELGRYRQLCLIFIYSGQLLNLAGHKTVLPFLRQPADTAATHSEGFKKQEPGPRRRVMTNEGAVGASLGLLSGLRRPPDLGYLYRRILPEKVASCSNKTFLFYSSSHSAPI